MEKKNMKIIECKFDRQDGYYAYYSCRTDADTVISAHTYSNWRKILGDEYICAHLVPKKVGQEVKIMLSWEDYYNDTRKNPPRTRKLKWVGFDCARGCDIFEDTREPGQIGYRSITDRRVRWLDFAEETSFVKPNVTFVCPEKGICEKIRYDDDLSLIAEPVEEVKNNA